MVDPAREIVRVAPKARLSRRSLIFLFVVMIGVGLGVYSIFPPSVGGPPLPVSVRVGEAPVEARQGNVMVLAKVVEITNESDAEIQRLSIELNGQYLLFQDSPLEAGETWVLPQEIFTDKRSSWRFDPTRHRVEEVVVTGQLPSRARGVSKFEFQ